MASVVVNGIPYDWGGIEFDVNGKIITGITSISYSHEMMTEILMGAGRNPYGRTDGVYKPGETEFECYESSFRDIIQTLGAGYMMKEFSASVSYSHTGDNTSTDELLRCRIVKGAHSHKQGPNGLIVKASMSVLRYKIHGLDPVNS